VVAFTAAQIPHIADRCYPPELAGDGYPDGIPIYPESDLAALIRRYHVDVAAFSYSDVPYADLMHKASLAMAGGAAFMLPGPAQTMLKSKRTVVAVCAVRTGCGKSQTTRKICEIFSKNNRRVVAVRHPMPYGDLRTQVIQRFSNSADFDTHRCTIEEREEYEPLVDQGIVVYAGIDYAGILAHAEEEADIIVWDGGNNDTPFYRPDVHIVLFDPHRAGHERLYYPGETNLIMADIAVINKMDSARPQQIAQVRQNIERYSPKACIVEAVSPVRVRDPGDVKGRRVLVVEDGPTLTHGEMAFGAGFIAAQTFQASDIVDPRPFAVGSIAEIYQRYPHIGPVLPAMGYTRHQVAELEMTIANTTCDLVLFATPAHLPRILKIHKPSMRVFYDYMDHGSPTLQEAVFDCLKKRGEG